MKIYTKTGDKGETGLFGGERVSKNSPRLNAYGTIDELNAYIGLAVTEIKDEKVKEDLLKIQNHLFTVGTDLATPDNEKTIKLKVDRTPSPFYENIENLIDSYEAKLDELKNFILPGGSKSSAMLHVCRTICRRAEREVVALNSEVKIENNILIFLNRLSDLLFVLSRFENRVSNFPDIIWNQKS
ncbi:MAG: cob(I)yrinic acid a,c-diamide adenosyltransferase [Ignavibacteria bacterium]|nr:cob(I)yrinic acid a,c-diamide adenosyltransferase [Ignavibacteria bacterium]MBT8380872.1 cob(I)yrinic acid a,c-diamide adenosyltransferase [Ignavibacteria bacterium]